MVSQDILTDRCPENIVKNLFGNDGVLYKQQYDLKDSFTFATQTDIESAITNVVEPVVRPKN